ncbi:MAG TPA: phosphatidate cytidylyltransferase [Flavipsychrobacter sp.]
MNKLTIAALLLLLVTFSGCELVGDIFEAGVWVGVLLVVVVIAGIIFLFRKISGK